MWQALLFGLGRVAAAATCTGCPGLRWSLQTAQGSSVCNTAQLAHTRPWTYLCQASTVADCRNLVGNSTANLIQCHVSSEVCRCQSLYTGRTSSQERIQLLYTIAQQYIQWHGACSCGGVFLPAVSPCRSTWLCAHDVCPQCCLCCPSSGSAAAVRLQGANTNSNRFRQFHKQYYYYRHACKQHQCYTLMEILEFFEM